MIILNEKEYAEKILKNREIEDKPFTILTILAKYYYHHLGYRKKKITELLADYMEKHYPYYSVSKSTWDDSIEKIAAKAGKFTLYEIAGIWITKVELEIIQNIHNKVLERLAFTMLCLAKLNNIKNSNNNGWVNTDSKEIFKLARISCTVDNRYKRIGELNQLGLLEFPKNNSNLSSRVTFMNDNSDQILFVSDFRELGYEYLKFNGENFIHCQECGILVRNNKAGNKKYCSACAGYIPQKTKTILCIDCGKEVEINSMNNKSLRCKDCQNDKDRESKRIWKANKENDRY